MICVPEAADDGHEVAAGTWLAGLGTVLREWGRIGITGFGGLAFIVPGLIIILFLSALFLAGAPLSAGWQFAVLAGAAVLLLALRRGVVLTLLGAAAVGLVVAFAGGPLPR
jgi:hypothetical protein